MTFGNWATGRKSLEVSLEGSSFSALLNSQLECKYVRCTGCGMDEIMVPRLCCVVIAVYEVFGSSVSVACPASARIEEEEGHHRC